MLVNFESIDGGKVWRINSEIRKIYVPRKLPCIWYMLNGSTLIEHSPTLSTNSTGAHYPGADLF